MLPFYIFRNNMIPKGAGFLAQLLKPYWLVTFWLKQFRLFGAGGRTRQEAGSRELEPAGRRQEAQDSAGCRKQDSAGGRKQGSSEAGKQGTGSRKQEAASRNCKQEA